MARDNNTESSWTTDRTSAFERVSVFKFWWCSRPLILCVCGWRQTLVPGAAGRLKLSPLHALAAWLVVLIYFPWKLTQHCIKQDRTVLSWFCCHISTSILGWYSLTEIYILANMNVKTLALFYTLVVCFQQQYTMMKEICTMKDWQHNIVLCSILPLL